jgi:glutamate synthase (NADPH/NADH) large chain
MSGGIAFVYDIDGQFASRVNPEMVDVLPLDAEDTEWLQGTLREHIAMTDSPRAKQIVAQWDDHADKFAKVLPRDYARVMAVLAKASVDGLSEEETSRRVMESVHG